MWFSFEKPEEPQYLAFRSDPAWRRTYKFLRRGYWHGTQAKTWSAIRTTGAIKPNVGQFPMSWPQTEMSYGYNHGCVMLFDFVTPTEEQVIRTFGRVYDVLMRCDVLLRIDRRRLRQRIIPNSAAHPCRRRSDGRVFGCIQYCEVFYPGDITLRAISQVYRVPMFRDYREFKPVRVSLDDPIEPRRAIHTEAEDSWQRWLSEIAEDVERQGDNS